MYCAREYRGELATLAAISAVVALAGCADIAGSRAHRVSLSIATRPSTAAPLSSREIRSDVTIGSSGELVLKKIQLAFGKIEVSRSDNAACADDDEDSGDDDGESGDDIRASDKGAETDDCEDVSSDPILVNVPVDDAVHTFVEVPLAAGTYKRLKAKLQPVDAGQLTALGGPSDMSGNSVRVEGTYKGAPFVFTSPMRSKLELEFDPPLVVDASTKNATVNIDVTKWFTTRNGAVIDPASANSGGPNAQLVASNIRSSFKAFEDDDREGDDDNATENSGDRDR